jgi:hypothetical protein
MPRLEESPAELRGHFESTYYSFRLGIAVIGVILPAMLWQGGMAFASIPLLGSMSAYYYTGMRDVFVGALCAVGVALYHYKGFSKAENLPWNAAGGLAVASHCSRHGLVPTGRSPTMCTLPPQSCSSCVSHM